MYLFDNNLKTYFCAVENTGFLYVRCYILQCIDISYAACRYRIF